MRRLAAILIILSTTAPLAACGDEEEPATAPEPTTTVPAAVEPDTDAQPNDGGGAPKPDDAGPPTGPAEGPEDDPRPTALERAAERTVREYVAALDARDGELACSLLAPGVIDEVELPRTRGDCAGSLEASIGYRDPRGLPVWESTEVADVVSLQTSGEGARVVVTVVTRFADRDEPSIEDDIVYLTRDGADWLIAKPSSTLYRAVGIAEVPPSVLTPP